jgi:hypothetical protein
VKYVGVLNVSSDGTFVTIRDERTGSILELLTFVSPDGPIDVDLDWFHKKRVIVYGRRDGRYLEDIPYVAEARE